MSYEIIYKSFTIKKGDTHIPFVVWGSNNCYEISMYGYQRRERNIDSAKFLFLNRKSEFKSLSEMDSYFCFKEILKDMNDGMLQGIYKSPHGLLKSFHKYIFNSDELKLQPKFSSLYYCKMTDSEKEMISDVFNKELEKVNEVLTEQEMITLIDKCLHKLEKEIRGKLLDYTKKEGLIHYRYEEYEIKFAFDNKYHVTKNKKFVTYEEMQNIINNPNTVNFKEISDNEFIEKIKPFCNKQVVLQSDGNLFRGRIKETARGDIGFFKYGIKNRYNILSKNGSGYAQLKVDKLVEI